MKIGINLLWLIPGYGGLETYARGLISGLAQSDSGNEFVLFTNFANHRIFEHLPSAFTRRLCRLPMRSRVAWRVIEQFMLSTFAAREKLDLLHAPADLLPPQCPCPSVVTIHDVNFYSLSDPLPPTAGRLFEWWVRRSARRADAIITVSEFSRAEIAARFRLSPYRVEVVHNGPASRPQPPTSQWPRLAARLGLSGDYIITVADGSPHKNLGRLLQAFARLRDQPVRLVVAGAQKPSAEPVSSLLRKFNLDSSVIFAGYLDDNDFVALMSHARMLACPSMYEGFGLPVIEAMTVGVPVACSRIAALPEVAGAAASYFDPTDVADIAATLDRLMHDEALRTKLIEAGARRAKHFSWNRAAMETIAVYQRAATAAEEREKSLVGFKPPADLPRYAKKAPIHENRQHEKMG
jgi:glycosyltransferase involved in cell wall biosynthesis